MNLDQASRAILGVGVDTSSELQTDVIFDEGSIALRESADRDAPLDREPTVTPTTEPPPNGSSQPNGQQNGQQKQNGPSWATWALAAALLAGVGVGVYYYTRERD